MKQVKIHVNSNDYEFYSGNFYKPIQRLQNNVVFEDNDESINLYKYEITIANDVSPVKFLRKLAKRNLSS